MKSIMRHIRLGSFATRMSVYVLSFMLIVFTVVMGLFYVYSRQKATDNAIQYTHEQLKSTAIQINGLLQTVETTMNQSVWMIEKELSRPDSLRQIITAVALNNDLIVGSGIAFRPDFYKEKGKYYMPYVSLKDGVATYQVLGGTDYDYPCMDWYLIPQLLKRNYWSEPYYDSGGGNIIMSTYSMPLYDGQGELYAVFTANISLEQFTGMVSQLEPYKSSFTFLLSRNGSYLTHPDHEKIMNETIFSNAFESDDKELELVGREMLDGHTGTKEIKKGDNPSFMFYTTISNNGWSVGNVCQADAILGDLDAISRKVILLFLICIVFSFLIIYGIIRKVVRPLEEFSRSARLIATGRFDVELLRVNSDDEIKDLHDSLVYMQRSLSSYVAELQQTTATKERIESELSIAREIQMGMIPKTFPPFPERKDVDLYAFLSPAKEVGGDLYDFFIEESKLYFIIGDVSGKGIPASLFMAITRSLFRTLAPQVLSPAEVVKRMNNSISENNESSIFVTFIVGILDLRTGMLKVSNAGHNPPLLILPDGQVAYMNLKANLLAGMMENFPYIDEVFTLERGTKLFLYTDGVTEAENAQAEFYGEERLENTVSACSSLNVCDMVHSVVRAVSDHVQEAEPSDDLTIFIIHYKPEINHFHDEKRERDPISE